MAPPLSPHTTQLIETLFSPKEMTEASHWLETECGNNLPFCDKLDAYGMERIRFAAIKPAGETSKNHYKRSTKPTWIGATC